MIVSDEDIERVAHALGGAPARAYTTPIVYPWAAQNFVARLDIERSQPPAGPQRLYVHLPFCNYHCTFCFYAVRTGARRAEMERYVAAIRRELTWVPGGSTLSRLVVGGGTPTALPADLFDAVFQAIFERAPSVPGAMHTVEASPDSLTDEHLEVLRRHGIGRMSIGIESLDDAVLDAVHRRHTPAEALAACRRVVDHGLTLNIDLIYGLPGQSASNFGRDLKAIAEAGVDSLCLYGLRLNERTVVARQLTPEERLDLGRVMRWRAFVRQAAEDLGFVQTRCYTFRRATSRSSWHERAPAPPDAGMTSELGIGMSARSQLGAASYRNHDHNETYMQRIEQGLTPVHSIFELGVDDLKTQFVATLLANGRPLARSAYEATFGGAIDDDFGEHLARLSDAGLTDDDGNRVVLTDLGRLVYDRVLLGFYPQRARRWLAALPPHPERRRGAAGAALATEDHGSMGENA